MNYDSFYIIKRIFLYLLIFHLGTEILLAQKLNLKLEDAVTISLNQNEKVKQLEKRKIQKEYSDKAAWGNFLPYVNLNISYNHLNEPLNIDLNPVRSAIIALQSSNQAEFANVYNIISTSTLLSDEQKNTVKLASQKYLDSVIPQFKETLKEKNYLSGNINFVQPIFMGGKLIAAKKVTSIELNSVEHEKTKVTEELISEVVNLYLQTIMLQHVVTTREHFLEGIIKHKERARKLLDEGIIAYNQYLNAVVASNDAEQKLIEDKNNYELSLLALKYKLNLPEETEIFLSDTLTFNSFNFNDDEFNFNDQPILKIIEDKQELIKQNYNASRSAFLPAIYGFGKYELYPQYLSALEPRFIVGIQLNYNLFNGFKDYNKLQEIKNLEQEINYLEKETHLNLELARRKALLEIQNNYSRYEKLDSTIYAAEEKLRQNEKRFETGLGNSFDVIDAHLNLEKIQLDKLNSVLNYYKAVNQYALILGKPELFFSTFYNRSSK